MKLNKKGFTLVELLAVIVVLALLMVVAASSIGTALDNSKKSALRTETQKLVKQFYEAGYAEKLTNPSFAGTSYTGTEGDYEYRVTVDATGKITYYCVQYLTNKSTKTYDYFMTETSTAGLTKVSDSSAVQKYAAASGSTAATECSVTAG